MDTDAIATKSIATHGRDKLIAVDSADTSSSIAADTNGTRWVAANAKGSYR